MRTQLRLAERTRATKWGRPMNSPAIGTRTTGRFPQYGNNKKQDVHTKANRFDALFVRNAQDYILYMLIACVNDCPKEIWDYNHA
jgi:hypothetical protein